jgi:hypothetical protein
MRQIQIRKLKKISSSTPLDLRTPSGATLPY